MKKINIFFLPSISYIIWTNRIQPIHFSFINFEANHWKRKTRLWVLGKRSRKTMHTISPSINGNRNLLDV